MRRRPRWLPLAAAVFAVALFVGLGTWQVQRADERERALAAIAAAEDRPAEPLPRGKAALRELTWYRVEIEGRFLAERQFLLDNRTVDGRPGFDVLTPFVLDDGRTVLVDRGWTPADSREPAEPVHLSEAGRRVDAVTGRLWRPESGFRLGPALTGEDRAWPRITTRVDYAALSEALDRDLVPAVVRIEEPAPWTFEPRPVTPRFGPRRHIGYAFQWYALALAVIVVSGILLLRARRRSEHE